MFKDGVSSLAFEDDIFVDRVFSLLDEDHSGTVEWDEFVNAVNALETGSAEDKVWTYPYPCPKPNTLETGPA